MILTIGRRQREDHAAEFLKKKYSIPVITADWTTTDATLLRDIQKAGMAKGFVLDGYPATRAQADHLGKIVKQLKLPPPVVVSLEVPDAVVRERLKGKKKPEVLDQRLSSYHQEMDLIRQYYPQADIWTVIGTRPVKRYPRRSRCRFRTANDAPPGVGDAGAGAAVPDVHAVGGGAGDSGGRQGRARGWAAGGRLRIDGPGPGAGGFNWQDSNAPLSLVVAVETAGNSFAALEKIRKMARCLSRCWRGMTARWG